MNAKAKKHFFHFVHHIESKYIIKFYQSLIAILFPTSYMTIFENNITLLLLEKLKKNKKLPFFTQTEPFTQTETKLF